MSAAEAPTRAYLDVTRASDGRYCVAFIRGEFNRRSYTQSAAQIIIQAQRAGGIGVRTEDPTLRQLCEEAGIALLDRGEES